jgi:putative flavoprotein involved in K+ transport
MSEIDDWLRDFAAALARGDIEGAAAMFADDCYWRDLVSFTWNIVTLESRAEISDMLQQRLADVRPRHFQADVREGWFSFETERGRAIGRVQLKQGRCHALFTALTALKGFEEKSGPRRELGVEHGATRNRRTWSDRRNDDATELGYSRQPYVLIVGGGQGGIALAARLKRLDVPALVVDKHPRVGDAWRSRYKSLCLHDPVWYDHLPYLPFPDHWPVYTPKDKMGDWLEAYSSIMELNYWTSSPCRKAAWNADAKAWEVMVERDGAPVTLRPKHLVLATGMSGFPERPQIEGAASFRGEQRHSSEHRGGEGYQGKRCIVVGSNNSAHDIAADLWEHGAEVTMLQRSATMVIRSETLARLGRTLYSEEAVKAGITAEVADLMLASTPYALQPVFARAMTDQVKRDDAAFYARLRAAGFMLTFGEDESGLGPMYARRGSGYYIDVGASDLIADGLIALKTKVEIARLTPHSAILSNGEELAADLIVYATGYGSMSNWAAALISQEVADRIGPCWGLGSDTAKDPGPWQGELRNMWKPTAQENLWFHGGNLAQSRHYSRYLALQLKARREGLPTPVYARRRAMAEQAEAVGAAK